MAAERRQVGIPRRGLAVAASVGAHALLLVMFILGFRSWPVPSERPVMEVALAPPLPTPARNPPPQRRRERKVPQLGANPRPAPSAPDDRAAVKAPQPPEDGLSGGARQALRDLLGCDHAGFLGLSSEERRDCRDKAIANARGAEQLRLNLDPRGLYVVNPIPYLNRKPKNGCKVMAGGAAGPMGQQGAAVGIGCGKSF